MKTLTILAFACMINLTSAAEFPFSVYNPTDSVPKDAVDGLRPQIYDDVTILIEHLQEPKDSDFIKVEGVSVANRKWRVQNVTILTADIVAVNFTEGHIEVIGVFVRNQKLKRWDLKSEIHGSFRDKFLVDPQKTERGEQDAALKRQE